MSENRSAKAWARGHRGGISRGSSCCPLILVDQPAKHRAPADVRYRFLIRDRAGQCTEVSGTVLASAGIEVAQIPPRSTSANACAERWIRTVRAEVTDRMLIAGERHLRAALDRYVAHYHQHPRTERGIRGHRIATTTPQP